jgi:hypothetical protein
MDHDCDGRQDEDCSSVPTMLALAEEPQELRLRSITLSSAHGSVAWVSQASG